MDNEELGRKFRRHYVNGLRRLVRSGKLRLEGEWSKLLDPSTLEAWLDELTATDWNVFIEGPPNGESQPSDVLKYLARYITGGPISDRRIISDEHGVITFWARSKDKARRNESERFPLRGVEFVRRWAMHVLPKGYTRSRSYGGYHGSKRADYLQRSRQLLGITTDEPENTSDPLEEAEASTPMCARCETRMVCIDQQSRPSWKRIFERAIYADPAIYSPMHHMYLRTSTVDPVDEYG